MNNNNNEHHELEDLADRWGDNVFVKLISRILLIVTIPTGGWFIYDSSDILHDLQTQQVEMQRTQVETYTLLRDAVEPRVTTLEAELRELRNSLVVLGTQQFSIEDSRTLRTELIERIQRIERDLERLEDSIERDRTGP